VAFTKVTNIFKLNTLGSTGENTARTGGWTESWYFNGDITGAINANTRASGLAAVRARLLPYSGDIVGQRYQHVDPLPVGAAVSRGKEFPGNIAFATDIPQMSLLVTIIGVGVPNTKHHIVRGIPDDQVKFGEYLPNAVFKGLMFDYLDVLRGFSFKGIDTTIAKVPIVSFNEITGLVTTAGVHGFAVDEIAAFTGLKELPNDPAIQLTRPVIEVPSSTTFKVPALPLGRNFVIGFVRRKVTIYPAVDGLSSSVERAITRKVGRPFDQFRGRV